MSLVIEPVNRAYRFRTKDGEYVYIGDPEASRFRPSVVLTRWTEECYLRVSYDENKVTGRKRTTLRNNRVRWETPNLDLEYYPAMTRTVEVGEDPSTREAVAFVQNEQGGLELEIVLKEKPATNVFTFQIETKDLIFMYQPELDPDHPTWADRDNDGIPDTFRPENIVGSYAVYHAFRTNIHSSPEDADKYKVGKAFHIYRPLARDDAGNEAWCKLHVDEVERSLAVTVPQDFLDNAVYPVTIDPTFGYETAGGSYQAQLAGDIEGSVFSAGSSGTGDWIKYYGRGTNTGSLSVKAAIYDGTALVSNAETYSYSVGNTISWWQLDFVVGPDIAAQSYILCAWFEGGQARFYYDNDFGRGKYYAYGQDPDGFPDPASWSTNADLHSIYCSYSAAGQIYYVLQSLASNSSISTALRLRLALLLSGLTDSTLLSSYMSLLSNALDSSANSLIDSILGVRYSQGISADSTVSESVFSMKSLAIGMTSLVDGLIEFLSMIQWSIPKTSIINSTIGQLSRIVYNNIFSLLSTGSFLLEIIQQQLRIVYFTLASNSLSQLTVWLRTGILEEITVSSLATLGAWIRYSLTELAEITSDLALKMEGIFSLSYSAVVDSLIAFLMERSTFVRNIITTNSLISQLTNLVYKLEYSLTASGSMILTVLQQQLRTILESLVSNAITGLIENIEFNIPRSIQTNSLLTRVLTVIMSVPKSLLADGSINLRIIKPIMVLKSIVVNSVTSLFEMVNFNVPVASIVDALLEDVLNLSIAIRQGLTSSATSTRQVVTSILLSLSTLVSGIISALTQNYYNIRGSLQGSSVTQSITRIGYGIRSILTSTATSSLEVSVKLYYYILETLLSTANAIAGINSILSISSSEVSDAVSEKLTKWILEFKREISISGSLIAYVYTTAAQMFQIFKEAVANIQVSGAPPIYVVAKLSLLVRKMKLYIWKLRSKD